MKTRYASKCGSAFHQRTVPFVTKDCWMTVACAVLIALSIGLSISQAGLPNVTASELADLLERYQKRLARVQCKYTVTYGSFKDGDVSKGIFIPESPTRSVDAESALDMGAGMEYFRENKLTRGEHYIRESAFDGKIGTQVNSSQPGSDKWRGLIMKGPPDKLRIDKPRDWRPQEVAYWPIQNYSLADIIRKAEKIIIESDEIAGRPCYKTTFLFESKMTMVSKGKETETIFPWYYRAWLAPDLNMLPVRFERLRQNRDDPREINKDAEPEIIRQQSDFREVAPGIWFPFISSHVHIWPKESPPPFVFVVNIKQILLNEDAAVPARVQFPEGTHVTNLVAGVKYTVGVSSWRLLESKRFFPFLLASGIGTCFFIIGLVTFVILRHSRNRSATRA